jgi:ubiquinone biosynthesis protein
MPDIERALGRSSFDVFKELQSEPYAAASIAQVHRARLASGMPVVLKIRRPGVEAKIDADLRILEYLAQLVVQEMPEARRYQPTRIVAEFQRSLARELDLNIERFARNFADDFSVLIQALLSAFLLTMRGLGLGAVRIRHPPALSLRRFHFWVPAAHDRRS